MRHPAPDELVPLLESLANGGLTVEESTALNALMRGDAAARRAYVDWMAVESGLRGCCAQTDAGPIDGGDACAAPLLLGGEDRAGRARARPWGWLPVAASLVGAAFLAGYAVSHLAGTGDGGLATAATDDDARPGVARVTATRNCRWGAPGRRLGFGSQLRRGDRVELQSGVAEITFESGATVLLEGPATLDLADPRAARLITGRLSAAIPTYAQDYRLRTERLAVFEPGAEFGMIARSDGSGEVHVFSGHLNASLVSDTGVTIDTVKLAESEAVRVTRVSSSVTKTRADHARFVRSLLPTAGPHDGLYLHEPFDYPPGPLAWQNGGFGWAGPWSDIETADRAGEPPTNRVGGESLHVKGMVSTGGRAVQAAQSNRVRRSLSTSIGGVFDTAGMVENRDGHRIVGRDGTKLYVSFLQRVSKTDDVFYGLELHRGDGNSNRVLCVGHGADGAGYGVTSNYNAYGADNYPPLGAENTSTNMIVIRIDYGAGDRDTATVYRDPLSLTEESQCRVDARLRGDLSFDRVSLGNFEGSKVHEVDEIRIGASFRAVTGQRDQLRDRLVRRVSAWSPRGGRAEGLIGAGTVLMIRMERSLSTRAAGELLLAAGPVWGY